MTWTIKKMNNGFLVKGKDRSFMQPSRVDAERLCELLNTYNVLAENTSEDLIRQGEFLIKLGKKLAEVGR